MSYPGPVELVPSTSSLDQQLSDSSDTFSLSELTNNMPPKKKLDPLEFSGVAVDEAAVPNKFLTMPQSYSQYIEPKLKSDGMNLLNLSPSIDRVVRNLLINTIDLDL